MVVGALANAGPDDFAVASGTTLVLSQPVESSIVGGSLTLNGTITGAGSMAFGSGSTFTFNEGSISTDGSVVVDGAAVITGSAVRTVDTALVLAGTTTFGSAATINGTGALEIAGTTTASGTGSTIANDLYIAPNGTLQITATANNNMDITGKSFVNAGLILLGGSSTNTLDIDIINTTLHNEGTIQFTNTESSGVRSIRGNLDNYGTIDVDANANLLGSAASELTVDTRNGTIDIASGATLTVGGGSNVENIIVGPDTVLTGAGTLNFTTGNELRIDGAFVYTADMPTLVLGSAVDIVSNDGGPVTFTVAPGATLDISNIQFAAEVELINAGTLTSDGHFDILGSFTNLEGADLTATMGAITNYWDFGDDVNNYGTITVTETDASTSFFQFNVDGGEQFNNYGTITIDQSGSSAGTTATFHADIHNYGTFNVSRSVNVNGTGSAQHTNAGVIVIASGATLTLDGGDDLTNLSNGIITGAGTLDVSGTGVVFQNEGIVDVAGSDTAGALHIVGDMINTDASVIDIEVGNGINDTLDVSGEFTMAGTLNASFITASTPTAGDIFNVVTFGSAATDTYFDSIAGLEGDGTVLLDLVIDDSANGGITMTAVANAITPTSGFDGMSGSSAADYAYGGAGNDILEGEGGADVLLGGDGDDTIAVSDNTFHFIDGGDGTDKLVAHNGLDLSLVRNDIVSGFEVLDLGFGALTLDADDVVSMTGGTNALTGTDNTLVVTRNDFGEAIDIGTGWGAATTTTLSVDGEIRTFDKQVHSATGATIYVEQTVATPDEMTTALGIKIAGEFSGDSSGYSVSSAGDVNGDGFDDFIIGAPLGDRDQTADIADTGAAYVVFGNASGLTDIDLTDISLGDGTLGFKLEGGSAGDAAGISVSLLGDVNGDGFGDIIVGADYAGANGEGAAYVVFGKDTGFTNAYNLDALGDDGFKITGALTYDYAGTSVGGHGDINGDDLRLLIQAAVEFLYGQVTAAHGMPCRL